MPDEQGKDGGMHQIDSVLVAWTRRTRPDDWRTALLALLNHAGRPWRFGQVGYVEPETVARISGIDCHSIANHDGCLGLHADLDTGVLWRCGSLSLWKSASGLPTTLLVALTGSRLGDVIGHQDLDPTLTVAATRDDGTWQTLDVEGWRVPLKLIGIESVHAEDARANEPRRQYRLDGRWRGDDITCATRDTTGDTA